MPLDVDKAATSADSSEVAGAPEDIPYTNLTGSGCGPVFALEVEALARVMYEEMHYLGISDIRTWEQLSARELEDYAFVMERVLVEKEAILKFFANDSNIRGATQHR
jgi:hypothetical protein